MPRKDGRGGGNRDNSSNSNQLYPQLMGATANGDATKISELLADARSAGPLDENLLRVSLQNAAKKGHFEAAKILLENGAKTDVTAGKGSPALFWAVSQPQSPGHRKIAEILLHGDYEHCPADTEWSDSNGRTILMSAAWRGHNDALRILLQGGANINARDQEGRTILHNLAADKKCRWGEETVNLILEKPIKLNIKDHRHRSCLHWSAIEGKESLARQVLDRTRYGRINVNLANSRGQTALHLACSSENPVPSLVELLLKHGADPYIRSKGAFTCLHNTAGAQRNVEIVNILLAHAPMLLNATNSTAMTALHLAAQIGAYDVVECILSKPDTVVNAKDAYYLTPLLRAAQAGHFDIANRLAPFNNTNRLSYNALQACNGFWATIVDFRSGGYRQNLVHKKTVFEVLYAKDANDEHFVTTRADKIHQKRPGQKGGNPAMGRPKFRWIHLPANNLAWVEALVAKAFVEEGAKDVRGFKAIEKGFSQQHRGTTYHSFFMRPTCLQSERGTDEPETLNVPSAPNSKQLNSTLQQPAQVVEVTSSPERARRENIIPRPGRSPRPSENHQQQDRQSPTIGGTEEVTRTPPNRSSPGARMFAGRDGGVNELNDGNIAVNNSGGRRSSRRVDNFPTSESSNKSRNSKTGGQTKQGSEGSNISFFMPYLHFETDDRRQQMRQAIKRVETGASTADTKLMHVDEQLISAHLRSTTGLHVRRTLDQFYLHGINTDDRDNDQVVSRYCQEWAREKKLYMVDQLWMWILGPNLIITSFPQRWQQPQDDPLNVLEGIIEDVNSKTREPVSSVYDLALIITARCSGAFDRHKPADQDLQFMEMFESSIGKVNDRETTLYNDFYTASEIVHGFLSGKQNKISDKDLAKSGYPDVVETFIDIGKETKLLQEIKDIREELNMMSMVLNNQRSVLPVLGNAIRLDHDRSRNQLNKARAFDYRIEEQKRVVDTNLGEIDRMSKLAIGIERSLIDLLDLKQKQSNAFEARFARDQAAGTARQGNIIMLFTMVTIIFLPMSFVAAFFAINIQEFSQNPNGNSSLSLAYVSKYTFGIGLGVSLLLIAFAFLVDPIVEKVQKIQLSLVDKYRQRLPYKGSYTTGSGVGRDLLRLQYLNGEGLRKSIETQASQRSVYANGMNGRVQFRKPRRSVQSDGTEHQDYDVEIG